MGRDFENRWNGIECTMTEEDMYRWYCIGHQYLMDVGVKVDERCGQYFVNPIGQRRKTVEFGHIRIARIGLLTDIINRCGDVEFVFIFDAGLVDGMKIQYTEIRERLVDKFSYSYRNPSALGNGGFICTVVNDILFDAGLEPIRSYMIIPNQCELISASGTVRYPECPCRW